jgi:diaminopimelate decarboxylase
MPTVVVVGPLTREVVRGKGRRMGRSITPPTASEPAGPGCGASDVAEHVWVRGRAARYGLEFGMPSSGDGARLRRVALAEIAAHVGTPTYVYDAEGIVSRYRELLAAVGGAPAQACFAMKANSAQAVLRLLARAGAGADIVSGGELVRALAAGFPPERIVFSGVGKTDTEIDAALSADISSINVESAEELGRVSARAAALGRRPRVALRVNPDVDPATHPYLATGLRESKFGVGMDEALGLALRATDDPHLDLEGLACHIGSQIVDTSVYRESVGQLGSIVLALRERGVALRRLDIGGGLGIAYRPGDPDLDVSAWGHALRTEADALGLLLTVEPGRWLVADSGLLLTRVLGRKKNGALAFVILDAAMTELIRPALYDAWHPIVPACARPDDAALEVVDVVGPVCESGDFLAHGRAMPHVQTGELVLVLGAGAYGMTMASTYNSRPLAAEVLVQGDRWDVIRRRKTVEEMLADESVPDWLK